MFGEVPSLVELSTLRRAPSNSTLRLLRISAFAAVVAIVRAEAAAAPQCSVIPGGRVILASDAVDPDVFLWDSRERLIDYTAGQWGDTRTIFSHTVLTEPGTSALVVACLPKAAHPRYVVGDEDAVGVRLTSGPNRGRYGWVVSSDVHPDRTAVPKPAATRSSRHLSKGPSH